MSQPPTPLQVRVWGDFACFTRPEMKVERVSYPVMTPTAALGVLESIFWKPQFRWRVLDISVLKPISYAPMLRNEMNSRQSDVAAKRWRADGVGGYAATDDRAQRHTLALRDVDYLIRAEIILTADTTDDVAKYRDQFRRRVRDGRCFATPYLGCREFSAYFAEPAGDERAIDVSESLGPMLLTIDRDADASGQPRPRFFDARLDHGVLHIPAQEPV